ncbi:hypothetical protein KAH94_05910 [bacterium]|nr:hypothetical protein [bacterium]
MNKKLLFILIFVGMISCQLIHPYSSCGQRRKKRDTRLKKRRQTVVKKEKIETKKEPTQKNEKK